MCGECWYTWLSRRLIKRFWIKERIFWWEEFLWDLAESPNGFSWSAAGDKRRWRSSLAENNVCQVSPFCTRNILKRNILLRNILLLNILPLKNIVYQMSHFCTRNVLHHRYFSNRYLPRNILLLENIVNQVSHFFTK